MGEFRFAFAGDRNLAVDVLKYVRSRGEQPSALLLSGPTQQSHADELRRLCPGLDQALVFEGSEFREEPALEQLRSLQLDMVLSIHFPYLVPPDALAVARDGWVNLHPAYLPYNRGWHTPTWAILDGAPVGATLHFMDEGLDTGDIVHQRQLEVSPGDTADSLYGRLKTLELEVLREAWPRLRDGSYVRKPQDPNAGSSHRKQDLFDPAIQEIRLAETVEAGTLIRRLRALTTSRLDEAAYFESDGRRFRVRLVIEED